MGIGQNFGNKAEEYSKARRGMPEEFFNCLKDLTSASVGKNLLDVGCGTGIVTRKLQEMGFNVAGSDIDADMIKKAELDSAKNPIRYFVAPASNLPFDSASFDVVTASSAFHWFYDEDSVAEIRRVLKAGGIFVVANKHSGGFVRNFLVDAAREYIPADYLETKSGYDPEKVLAENGFEQVEQKTIPITETYSIDEMCVYVQSISTWSYIPKDREDEVIGKLGDLLSEKYPEGTIERSSNLVIVSGKKIA